MQLLVLTGFNVTRIRERQASQNSNISYDQKQQRSTTHRRQAQAASDLPACPLWGLSDHHLPLPHTMYSYWDVEVSHSFPLTELQEFKP